MALGKRDEVEEKLLEFVGGLNLRESSCSRCTYLVT